MAIEGHGRPMKDLALSTTKWPGTGAEGDDAPAGSPGRTEALPSKNGQHHFRSYPGGTALARKRDELHAWADREDAT